MTFCLRILQVQLFLSTFIIMQTISKLPAILGLQSNEGRGPSGVPRQVILLANYFRSKLFVINEADY